MQDRRQRQDEEEHAWQRYDRLVGVVATLAWCSFMRKYVRGFSLSHNAQWMGMIAAVLCVLTFWPMAHLPSYRRFRTPAVVALRLACFVRPFCYTREWVDAISPGPNPGRLGPLTDFLELCMASNVNLLVFSAVGLLLPFRLHLALHTLNAAVNAAFGLHPFCAGRLLSSAATAGRAQAFHRWAAVAATSLAPGSMRLVPQSERGQTAAFLLFLWATAGWLLPTLLLLPREQPTQSPPPSAAAPAAAAARQQGSKPPPSLLGGVESLLRLLRYGAGDTVACRAGTAIAGGEAPLRPLAWWVLLTLTWAASCVAAS